MKKIKNIQKIIIILILSMFYVKVYAETNEIQKIEIGTTTTGIQNNNEKYSFEIEVHKAGRLTIDFSTNSDVTGGTFDYTLTDYFSGGTAWNSLNGKFSYSLPVYVEKGKYIYEFNCSGNGTYKIEVKFEEASETFFETREGGDNTFSTANNIKLKDTYYGLIMNNDVDVYKFTLKEKTSLSLILNCHATTGWFNYVIYDKSEEEVVKEMLSYYDKSYGGSGFFEKTHELTAGNYYIAIMAMGSTYGGPYSLSVSEKIFEQEQPKQDNPVTPDNPTASAPQTSEEPAVPSIPSQEQSSLIEQPEKSDELEKNENNISNLNKDEHNKIEQVLNPNIEESNNDWVMIGIGVLIGGVGSVIVFVLIKIIKGKIIFLNTKKSLTKSK